MKKENPERIVTLGGDCSSSVVPFTYLAAKYPDDVALVWIDAHPDINMPHDKYKGYHAMALAACLGLWNDEIIQALPAKFDISKTLLVGVRDWDEEMKDRQSALNIKGLFPAEVAENSSSVLEWLKKTGVSKVVVHCDLDVLDPEEIIAAVGIVPHGMKIKEVSRLISDIGEKYDILSLTVAEPMPRTAIKIRNLLHNLPLFKD